MVCSRRTDMTAPFLGLPQRAFFRPILPEVEGADDQGDPYVLIVPNSCDTPFRYYAYHTDNSYDEKSAFDVYGSDDLMQFSHVGNALGTTGPAYRWAPCVRWNGEQFVMFYSQSTPGQPNADVGHRIRRAVAPSPVGPFFAVGDVVLPDHIEFSIDADV